MKDKQVFYPLLLDYSLCPRLDRFKKRIEDIERRSKTKFSDYDVLIDAIFCGHFKSLTKLERKIWGWMILHIRLNPQSVEEGYLTCPYGQIMQELGVDDWKEVANALHTLKSQGLLMVASGRYEKTCNRYYLSEAIDLLISLELDRFEKDMESKYDELPKPKKPTPAEQILNKKRNMFNLNGI